MEHLLFHWEDITDLLIDELIEEEVHERNRIEELGSRTVESEEDEDDSFNQYREEAESAATRQSKALAQELAEQKTLKETVKGVDMRDIMRLFDDYLLVERSIVNRL